jgi:uncharacterized protein (TIGR03032 family)
MAVHDVALLDQQAIAVSSLFNCIVVMNPLYSFVPLWKPKFISGLVAEDRCHLNGLALEQGKPRYVTVLGESDVVDGWREKRASGGCVIDVRSNEIICRGLSMPHAPRLYGGDLWVLASGSGELGIVTPHGWEPLLKLPGFLRGLAFHGPYAFVGLSKLRDRRDANLFGELPIEAAGTQLKCGIYIIHLQTGAIVGWLEFTEGFTEIYDVQVLPARNPGLATMQRDEVQELFHLPTGNQMLKGKRS